MAIINVLENITEVEGDDTLEQMADTAAEVGEQRGELADVGAEIAADAADIDQGEADAQELEAIGEVAERSLETGEGLSEQSAELATIAIERIHNRLGFRGHQTIVRESSAFGQAGSRIAATIWIKESISEHVTRVWRAIKAMAVRLWERISGFFKSLFGSAKTARNHLENLRKRAEAISPDAKMKSNDDLGETLAKKISVKKKADFSSYKQIADNSMALLSASQSIVVTIKNSADAVSMFSSEVMKDPSEAGFDAYLKQSSEFSAKTFAARLAKATLSDSQVSNNKKDPKAATKSKVVKEEVNYGPFANGVVIKSKEVSKTITLPKKGSGDAQTMTIISHNVAFEKMKDSEFASKSKPLNQGEILEVISEATKLSSSLESYEKTAKDFKSITDGASKTADNALKALEKIADDKANADVRVKISELRENVASMMSAAAVFGNGAPSTMMAAIYAGADYASASIANFR